MSTKISNLPELGVNQSGGIDRSVIDGNEFFPIIDFDANNNLQTFKIKLDTLFLGGQGFEKLTDLAITEDSNTQFKLTYTKEDNSTDVITIDKYAIQNGDVFFQHIRTADYFTSDVGNLIESDAGSNVKLATAGAIDTHITHRLYGTNEYDDGIKEYFGDSTTSRTVGTHILKDFRLNSEVAQDFLDLLDDVRPSLNTFKKIEEQFDTIDYSDKIGTSQVNIDQFVILEPGGDLSSRLNIKPLAIGTGLLNTNAVTTVKIKDAAITTAKINDGAVTTTKLNVDSVVTVKIKDEAVTPAKLSAGAPQWNTDNVNILNDLNVTNDINVINNIKSFGTDISLFNSNVTNRSSGNGRAISHDLGDTLVINKFNDYVGGVHIKGLIMAPDQHVGRINASTDNTLVTKAYVDQADILLNPIAEDKIQDDAIIHRHMTPDSVDTEELFDFCVTSPKVEEIGPHWDDTGTVKLRNKLDIDGHDLTIGDIGGTSTTNETRLILRGPETTDDDIRLRRGLATVARGKGVNGNFILNNSGTGDLIFSRSGQESFRLTPTAAKLPKTLEIAGGAAASINGTNLSNIPLLIGNINNGIGIDNNEIVQKGGRGLNLGVADPRQGIFLRAGTNVLLSLSGNSGNLSVQGDVISETGIIRRNGDTSNLTLRGGTTNSNGANIQLYGVNNAANANQAIYDADIHRFRVSNGSVTALEIDSKTRRVKLFAEGTLPNHLVTKKYVDDEVFKPIQSLDIITSRMESGFYQTSNAIFGNGWPETTNGFYHLLTNTHSNTANYNALQFAASYTNQEVYFRSTNNNGNQAWSKLWHTNNQGAGSGLDADLLDGKEAAAFSLISHLHDDRYRKLNTLIGYNDLTVGAPSWDTTKVSIPNNLDVSLSATIDNDLNVGGQITQNGADFKIFNQSRAGSGNIHSGRALVHGVNDTLNINFAQDYTGGVLIHGNIIARDQSMAFIKDNSRALATQEYVLSKQAETFPDINYIRKIGDNVFGTLSWTNVSGEGLEWSKNTDKASIKFYNEGDNDPDCRLQFEIGDNNTEYFTFVLNPSGGRPNITLLKIGHSELSYKGYDVWHDGNTTAKVDEVHLAKNAVTNIKISDNAVNERKLASNSVTGSKIPDGTITSSHILDLSITTPKIVDNAVTSAKIVDNAIIASKIPNSSIVTSKILDKAITTIKIDNNAVNNSKIIDNAITTDKIANLNVTTNKIANFNVTSEKIADNAIISNKLPNAIITTEKIRDAAVTSEKIVNLSITSEKIVNSNVTAEKILNGAISPTKLSPGGPSWNANNNLYVKGTLVLGQPVGGAGPYTGITATRVDTVDTLCLYANDSIKFSQALTGDPTMHIYTPAGSGTDGGRVAIGSNVTGAYHAKLAISDRAVPLSFKETDQDGEGSLWRMPLDGKSLRFDSSNNGNSFGSDYTDVLAMFSDGRVVARSFTKTLINKHSRSLVTKEYVDDKVAEDTVNAEYVQTSIANALTFKSILHYVDMYNYGRTPVNSHPSASMITWAKGQLGTTVKSGHHVMVRVKYYEAYRWGNGGAYRDRERAYIYRVSGTYPNSSWSIRHVWNT